MVMSVVGVVGTGPNFMRAATIIEEFNLSLVVCTRLIK